MTDRAYKLMAVGMQCASLKKDQTNEKPRINCGDSVLQRQSKWLKEPTANADGGMCSIPIFKIS